MTESNTYIAILIIIIIIVLLISFVFRSEDKETHIHPKPIHDQNKETVVIRTSPHVSEYKLVSHTIVTDNDGNISEKVEILDTVTTNGSTGKTTLDTCGFYDSSQLLVTSTTPLRTDTSSITKTITTDNTYTFTNLPGPPGQDGEVMTSSNGSRTFDYNVGDVLDFKNLRDCNIPGDLSSCNSIDFSEGVGLQLQITIGIFVTKKSFMLKDGDIVTFTLNTSEFPGIKNGSFQVVTLDCRGFTFDLSRKTT